MTGLSKFLAAVFGTPPDDVPPCVAQANSFREVVSLLYWGRQLPGQ
jgi:hypothetical protein